MEKQIKEVLTGNSKGSSKKRKSYSFTLCYKNIIIGKLFITSGKWYFQYNSEFKNQEKIAPLIGFPNKNVEYISNELWPFFDSRIPNLNNPKIKSIIEKNNIEINNKVSLLKKFGRKTIANPFILESEPV